MRKRIVIGLLAIIGVGVLVYVISQPSEGSVEWHKRKYAEAWRGSSLEHWTMTHGSRKLQRLTLKRNEERIAYHRQALVEAGYLARKEFIISNCPAWEVRDALRSTLNTLKPHRVQDPAFPHIERVTTNSITLQGRANEMGSGKN